MSLVAQLTEGLQSLGLSSLEPEVPRLLAYQALLAKWNATYNLTAIREPERMVSHHLLDSLAILTKLPTEPMFRVLDVGTGAGLPGIPLAIGRPHWKLTLLDSSHKKTAFVQQAVIELRLPNVTVKTARVESFPANERYDYVVSRAFSELAEFTRVAGHLVKLGGEMLAMKGVHPQHEIDALSPPWKAVSVEPLRVPGLDADRTLVKLLKAA
jgi:16S rRNA (guanine527-N7)-methyltransferase